MIQEIYNNKTLGHATTSGHPTARWWVHPEILVGGSINPQEVTVSSVGAEHPAQMQAVPNDWNHLRDDLGIQSVMNLEAEQSDQGKGSGMLLGEFPIKDHSRSYDTQTIQDAIKWAVPAMAQGPLYIHCHMGGGRSAALAYAGLRARGFQTNQAIGLIQVAKHWAFRWNGQVVGGSILEYPAVQRGTTAEWAIRLASIETALLPFGI